MIHIQQNAISLQYRRSSLSASFFKLVLFILSASNLLGAPVFPAVADIFGITVGMTPDKVATQLKNIGFGELHTETELDAASRTAQEVARSGGKPLAKGGGQTIVKTLKYGRSRQSDGSFEPTVDGNPPRDGLGEIIIVEFVEDVSNLPPSSVAWSVTYQCYYGGGVNREVARKEFFDSIRTKYGKPENADAASLSPSYSNNKGLRLSGSFTLNMGNLGLSDDALVRRLRKAIDRKIADDVKAAPRGVLNPTLKPGF